ncbi:hypothetical protein JCM3765_004837 [Sporobolomyces pararoseus]
MEELSYEYVDQAISASLECPICRSPLVDPIMPRACQHIFCSSCLNRALDLASTCPIDRTRIKNRKEELVEAPRVVIELLGELRVKCNSCREELKREEWGRHEAKCRAALNLGQKGRNREVTEAQGATESSGSLAEEQEKVCELCQDSFKLSELASHIGECAQISRPCRYCTELLPSSQHASHLLQSCPLVPAPCPHASFGCTHVGPRETLPNDHLYTECAYEPLKGCFERFKEREREWEGENWELKRKVEGLEQRLEQVEGLLRDTKYSFGDYFVHSPVAESQETPERPLPPSPLASTLSNLSSRNTSLSSSLHTLTQSHTDSLHTTQHLVEELNSMRSVIGGMRMQMGDLMRTVQYLSSAAGGPPRDHFAGGGYMGEGSGMGRKLGMRPGLGSRRSDSSSDEHDPEQDQYQYQDVDRYLSSSASDPEEDLLMFSSPPTTFSKRPELFSRPSPLPVPMMHPHSFSHLPPNRSTWTPGFDYGGGPPSLFNSEVGGLRNRPPYLAPGQIDRRNGRVVGGIGGGMKL